MTSYQPSAAVLAAGRSTVGDMFRRRVPAHPARAAIIDGARVVTYAELESRSNRVAQVFAARGLGRGSRVALLARNCSEYLE
ncbi:MAG: AMP-binding protein, partial [Gammaproteobacteria bacterium]